MRMAGRSLPRRETPTDPSGLSWCANLGTLLGVMKSPPPAGAAEDAVEALRRELGDELHSCCLYGSAVRGNTDDERSDLNLLIVLRTSDAETQSAVSRAIGANPRIEPFVLGLAGFERSVRAFAAKFASIRRHYRVLYGADPLASIEIAPELERFLCEQSMRNLRLRLAHSFITRQQHKNYGHFLANSVTPLFLRLSEILRLNGTSHPIGMSERIPAIVAHFGVDTATLQDLLQLKAAPQRLNDEEAIAWHRRAFSLINTAMAWIEAHWPAAHRVE